jgi:hypothetical protein
VAGMSYALPMSQFRRVLATVLALAAMVIGTPSAPASQSCQGAGTDPDVTPPETAIPGWPNLRATTEEIEDYFRQVDSESDRVRVRKFATSWNGRPLLYALVGTEGHVGNARAIAARQSLLRDPRRTGGDLAGRIARRSPAIAWYAGNIHGNETSGADAAIQLLYDLAARNDCVPRRVRKELLVGIIPTQNPDGRDAFSRQNAYGFDMNRDWFARTQREVDGIVSLITRYPPVLFIDAHEMGSSDFFFPPNDDPIHHEISPQSLHWINDLYGPAMRRAFEARQDGVNWDYFNYETYDLFYMGYGDTAPTTGFTSAGMTFEKGIADPDAQRMREQYVAGMATIRTTAKFKDHILLGYYRAHRRAVAEGRRGLLEPNRVYAPGSDLVSQVPDLRIRHYFLERRRAGADADALVSRLMKLGVEVHRLTRPLEVPDLQAYGRSPRSRTLPAGTYWIPMDQPQKRWIQALLGEDAYGSLIYFYDVAAWSNPLLMNVDASFSGDVLDPAARRLRGLPGGGVAGRAEKVWFAGDTAAAVAAALDLDRRGAVVRRSATIVTRGPRSPAVPDGAFVARGDRDDLLRASRRYDVRMRPAPGVSGGSRFRQPKVGLFVASSGGESLSHLRYTLERVWHLPYEPLTAAEVAAGALTTEGFDAFIVPGVATSELDPAQVQIQTWIEGGGTFVGTARPGAGGSQGGTAYAVTHGFTTSTLTAPSGFDVPGSLFRVRLRRGSPVTEGAARFAYWFHLGEAVLSPSTSGANAGRFPAAKPSFWFSGYAERPGVLRGSAALVDEPMGDGNVVLFSGEPNFRAFTEGPAFLLANAVVHPGGGLGDVRSPAFADQVRKARASGAARATPGDPLRIEVPAEQEAAALDVLRGFTGAFVVERAGTSAYLVVRNPRDLAADEHPFARKLLPALLAAGVTVRSAIL